MAGAVFMGILGLAPSCELCWFKRPFYTPNRRLKALYTAARSASARRSMAV